jgi:hypothetical protein
MNHQAKLTTIACAALLVWAGSSCTDDDETPAETTSTTSGGTATGSGANTGGTGGTGGSTPGCGTTPASDVCSSMCRGVCERLIDCGISWGESCLTDCYQAYACPGETLGHDDAICSGKRDELEGLECEAYCETSTEANWAAAWGGSCDLGGSGGSGGSGGAGGAGGVGGAGGA